MKTARFWFWFNDSPVKITVRENKPVTLYASHPVDEGFSFECEEFTLEQDGIRRNWAHGGRDCDGFVQAAGESFCLFSNLRANHSESGIDFPYWEEIESSVYDQYAQAMNY